MACKTIASLRAERDELRDERDELRVLLGDLTDTVARSRVGQMGVSKIHTAQVNVQLVERCKEALQ